MIKGKATRVFVFALAMLMAFTSVPLNTFTPLIDTAYADGGYIGGGDGDKNTVSGGKWLEPMQGIQITILAQMANQHSATVSRSNQQAYIG